MAAAQRQQTTRKREKRGKERTATVRQKAQGPRWTAQKCKKQRRSAWGAANGDLRDGGLSKSKDIWGKRPLSCDLWISAGCLRTVRKRAKKAEKGEKGWKRAVSRKGGRTPLKPPFVTPPFAAAQSAPAVTNRWNNAKNRMGALCCSPCLTIPQWPFQW